MSTALAIVSSLESKKSLTQYLKQHSQLTVEFPRNINHSLELARSIHPVLIIIMLRQNDETATKLCHLFKQTLATSHIPILLIHPSDRPPQAQIADAYLSQDFTEKEFNRVIRQFMMGY